MLKWYLSARWMRPFEQVPGDPTGGGGTPNDGDPSGGDPNAGGGGEPTGGTPAGQSGSGHSSSLTSDERQELERLRGDVESIRTESAAERDRLRRAILGDNEGGAPADPRTQRLREQFLRVFPEIGDALELAKRRKDIEGVLERAPIYDQQTQAGWRAQAETYKARLFDGLAESLLGTGKKGSDLKPEQQAAISEDFGAWLKFDSSGKRVERYNRNDESLVSEFIKSRRELYAPIQRNTISDIFARQPSAPSEGSSGSAPAGNGASPAAPQSMEDRLDAAIDRAAGAMGLNPQA